MALASRYSRALDSAAGGRHSFRGAARQLAASPPTSGNMHPVGAAAAGRRQPPSPLPQPPAGQQQLPGVRQQQQQQQPASRQHAVGPLQPPPPPQHSQQHRQEYESMKQQWHVKRTPLQQYPEDVQQRIRDGVGRGSSSSSGSSGQARPLVSTAGAAGPTDGSGGSSGASSGSRGGQAALVADLEKLVAALEYEKRSGYINVVGSMEKVPVADWAARHLAAAARQLPEPAAARHCAAAVQQLQQYGSLPSSERQTVVAAAESAVRQALLTLLMGGRTAAGRQSRYQAPAGDQQPQQAQQVPHQQPTQRPVEQQAPPQQQQPQPRQQRPLPPPPPVQQQQQRQPDYQQRPHPLAAAAAAAAAAAVATDRSAAQHPPTSAAVLSTATGPAWAAAATPVPAPLQAAEAAEPALSAPPAVEQDLDAAAEEAHAEEVGQQLPTPEGEEYVMSGNRRVKAATVAFRRSFAEAAAAMEEQRERQQGGGVSVADMAGGEQRSAQWFQMRERRLTASAFSKALGFFTGDREQLWGEKVGMVEPFKGNAATAWGTSAEPRALDAYEGVTGQHITSCMFQVKHDDPVHGWLGASPDGIIEALALDLDLGSPQQQQAAAAAAAAAGPPRSLAEARAAAAGVAAGAAAAASSLPSEARAALARGAGPLAGSGRGILEIKCPHNKGQPELAVPPQHATWYYMPQVQGLMYIFDCEWCNLYIWTAQNGSAVYHIRRDREYWARLWDVLAEFWWNHVVPARQEFQAGRWEEVEQYRPSAKLESTEELRQWSKRMALQAPVTLFKPQQ